MSLMSEACLKKYLNPTFVETGTQYGHGIKRALNVGFSQVISIEHNKKCFVSTKKRFANNKQVTLLLGRSQEVLKGVLQNINEKSTFWLDAHGDFASPLFLELEAIKHHPIKEHTLIIDDIRLFRAYGFTLDAVEAYVKTINTNYVFYREDGVHPKLDLTQDNLVAIIEK